MARKLWFSLFALQIWMLMLVAPALLIFLIFSFFLLLLAVGRWGVGFKGERGGGKRAPRPFAYLDPRSDNVYNML